MAKEFPGRWEKLAAANQRCERRAAENLPNMEIYFGESRIFFAEGNHRKVSRPPRRMRNGPCRAEPRMGAGKALRGGLDQGNNDVNHIAERVEQDEDTE